MATEAGLRAAITNFYQNTGHPTSTIISMSVDPLIHSLSRFWHTPVPAAMARLYQSTNLKEIGPCEFFDLEEMVEEPQRWRGMLPQFLPFGEDADENLFGIYALQGEKRRDLPILWWNHEYDHYLPVASEFEAFLRGCAMTGRYQACDSDDPETQTEQQIAACIQLLSLPADIMSVEIPRNERELAERLLRIDAQNARALANIGSMELLRGDLQRARDFLVRASEAAPWFSDPYFLLAETYRLEGNEPRACQLWWEVFESPVAFCSRTAYYGLCHGDEDAEIYQLAAERAFGCRDHLDRGLRASPLWKLLQDEDPFQSESRLELGRQYSRQGDPAAAEREYLNALTLATEAGELDDAYDALVLFYEAAGRERDAALCRYDAALMERH